MHITSQLKKVLLLNHLYILRSRYANEAEGLKYNGKQWKSFGHELVLGKFGDRPETFPRGSPICLDGTGLGHFFPPFFFPRKSTSSEDVFPLSFVGGFCLTESLLFLDTVLSCPDPVAIDKSFVSLAERCACNPRPGERKTCFPCQVTKRACFTRGQRWKRTCAVRRGGFRYDIQIKVSCSFLL